MPCNGDYLNPTQLEINLSNVYQLLDEVAGKKLPKSYGDGYDSRVYNQGLQKEDLDKKVEELCSKLQKLPKTKISKMSLEMQIWWRDHQEADKKRLKEELAAKKTKAAKDKAIAKLTPHERKLLGLK